MSDFGSVRYTFAASFVIAVLAVFAGSAAVADDESEIISLHDSLENALNDFDVDKTLALLDDDFVLINIPGTVTTGMDGIRAYFEMMVLGNDAYLKGARFEMHIEGEPLIRDGRFAFIHGSAINYYQFSVGGTLDLPTFWSATLVKGQDGWKISSLHISGNVFSNPMLDELYWIVLVVLISAVSITGTGAYMLARKYGKLD